MNFNKKKVIDSVLSGKTISEIAQSMGYSTGTLRNYMCANGIRVREIKIQALKEKMDEKV